MGARKQHHIRGKGQKKKKISLKFTVDCTHPVEDNIMDVANFVSTGATIRCTMLTRMFF